MMACIRAADFQLFKYVVELLLGAFDYLNHDEDDLACSARDALAKDFNVGGLYADVHTELDLLGSALVEINAHSSFDQIRGVAALSRLFGIFQLLSRNEPDSDSDNEFNPETPVETIQIFVDKLKAWKQGTAEAKTGRWVAHRLRLAAARRKLLKSLLASIKECLSIFETASLASLDDEFIQEYEKSDPKNNIDKHWERRLQTTIFTNAKDFHLKLRSTWSCACSSDRIHHNSFFSFYPSGLVPNCTTGTMYFPTTGDDLHGWKHTSYEYRRRQASVRILEHAASHVKHEECDEIKPEQFCSALKGASCDDSVRIESGSVVRRKRNLSEQVERVQVAKNLPLSPCSELPPGHPVYTLEFKFRLMLILYLAYAFMHLSGGCWWPYTLNSTVMLPDRIKRNTQPMVFFDASLLREEDRQPYGFKIAPKSRALHGSSFAKLLVGLWLGEPIAAGDLMTTVLSYEHTMFFSEMLVVVETCTSLGSTFPEEGPSEEMQNRFFEGAIRPIQRAVWLAFKTTALAIFAMPPAAPSYEEYKSERPARQQACETVATSSAHSTAPEYCLRDGKDQAERLNDER
jgi:hypothetical protein